MTTLDATPTPTLATAAPPFSRALRIVAGLSLIVAGLLNGLPQAVVAALTGDLSFGEQIAWGAEHPLVQGLEQTALVVSSLVMPLGLLAIAHVSRFRAPVLTAIATPRSRAGPARGSCRSGAARALSRPCRGGSRARR